MSQLRRHVRNGLLRALEGRFPLGNPRRQRLGWLWLAIAGIAFAPGAGRAQDAQATGEADEAEFTLNVNVDLVELSVVVLDEAGRHVTTLAEDDFQVSEDQVPQRLVLFRQEDLPVSLGLIVDNSRSMERKKTRVDEATVSFLALSNPEDEAFLIHFDDSARLALDFTPDPQPIERTLTSIQPYGQTALFDAVALGLETMGHSSHDQEAILVVSDGADNASLAAFDEVLEQVRQSDVVVYTIGILGTQANPEARHTLQALADAGGGRAFFPEPHEDISSLTRQIARELRDRYTIGYVPTNPQRDGTWRSVRVEVSAPEDQAVHLSYRHGYYAPAD